MALVAYRHFASENNAESAHICSFIYKVEQISRQNAYRQTADNVCECVSIMDKAESCVYFIGVANHVCELGDDNEIGTIKGNSE
uniref:Apple domain-containing protein n=1 Tax=Syphacia muris TaxID=451379 RepID=A0A0N5AP26_9BILA